MVQTRPMKRRAPAVVTSSEDAVPKKEPMDFVLCATDSFVSKVEPIEPTVPAPTSSEAKIPVVTKMESKDSTEFVSTPFEAISSVPKATPTALGATSSAPDGTSSASGATSSVPVSTSSVPEATSAAPEVTASIPGSTPSAALKPANPTTSTVKEPRKAIMGIGFPPRNIELATKMNWAHLRAQQAREQKIRATKEAERKTWVIPPKRFRKIIEALGEKIDETVVFDDDFMHRMQHVSENMIADLLREAIEECHLYFDDADTVNVKFIGRALERRTWKKPPAKDGKSDEKEQEEGELVPPMKRARNSEEMNVAWDEECQRYEAAGMEIPEFENLIDF